MLELRNITYEVDDNNENKEILKNVRSRRRLKAVQHAHAYLTRGDHYALQTEQSA